MSRALNPALKRAPSFSSMKEAMETAIGEQTAEQFRKIEYLNIIGNLGPLLGLLGTVLGMIQAFHAMEAPGGSASPATWPAVFRPRCATRSWGCAWRFRAWRASAFCARSWIG